MYFLSQVFVKKAFLEYFANPKKPLSKSLNKVKWRRSATHCEISVMEPFLNIFNDLFRPLKIFLLKTPSEMFFIKGFFIKCDQIRWKMLIWSHLLKKFQTGNFIFCGAWVLNTVQLMIYIRHRKTFKVLQRTKQIQLSFLENYFLRS